MTSPDSMVAASVYARRPKGVRVPAGLNPYKLVACDMDGTLLNSKHSISDYTRTILSQLLARGVHIIFATGRPFTDVYRIKRRLNIFAATKLIPTPGLQVVTPVEPSPTSRYPSGSPNSSSHSVLPPTPSSTCSGTGANETEKIVPRCFAITSNGACIYNEANERIYERTIDPRLVQELYSMFMDDPEVNINVFRGVDEADRQQQGYTNPSDQPDDKASEEWICRYPSDLEAALYKESRFTFRVVSNLEKTFPVDRVSEIFFLCYNPEKSSVVESDISKRMKELTDELKLETSVRVAPSATYCLDIVPSDVSKASALQHVLDKLDLTMNDCIAFGDGLNDVELLSSVGKGFIMGNGNPRLKKKLPHLEVIGRNDDDAVARKLSEIFDIRVEPGDIENPLSSST
ncbi:haloacid dehalogenase-like hydrolase-like protein [Leishmania infantum JPCM5]|uniref:Haloacid dehalogenase-like hydrolase-like protein n=2 Tax=Leishmania infantum TaxID=5671 RepID=A4I3L7_LEIIN|nr:haloacid dehalogenase-like hydrolase-like protein [Leishmania infantum JPCM5]CAC9503345.1 haloacid_dehalogenase-like_hydrolase-like_protein [Leishmania infantum]CAM69371.1 haloacid dehalogenase-like hydrolase-like protein [Leishmania infantum JPCM5]SUZ43309.1 haloacid_dehalogenase-like_hydrolase-like_protein [Leishmania infantum]|eukprot:XP_001470179.1 haloacid dehalogenase-like hydrolase-like protein [Leishmania infantum JPCM5]